MKIFASLSFVLLIALPALAQECQTVQIGQRGQLVWDQAKPPSPHTPTAHEIAQSSQEISTFNFPNLRLRLENGEECRLMSTFGGLLALRDAYCVAISAEYETAGLRGTGSKSEGSQEKGNHVQVVVTIDETGVVTEIIENPIAFQKNLTCAVN